MPGNLFTNYFLNEGIKATAEWRASISDSTAFALFRDGVRQCYYALSGAEGPNEAVTEQELIRPVLELLGWADYLPQQGANRNEDIPDYLLFTDAASKGRAATRTIPEERFRDAIVVEESKRFGLSLDARDSDAGRQSRTPHGQILRYLSTADIESDSRIRWGFLTNGGMWRLYDYRARPRATGYFEVDLGEMLESGGEDGLRLFNLLFRRDSFTSQQGATTSLLEAALTQGRRYEEKVAQDLSSVVFERVFPKLVQALADATGEDLSRVRHAALILLYRLLFVLYAEDRGLLPVNDRRYEDYGLRKPVRDHVAHRMQGGAVFSASASSYYDHLMTLFRQIDEGDESIGLPPYNGGLFASEAAPLLTTARLTDKIVGDIIYDLSHTETEDSRHFVNYRDMSVQQLGSIYERLLEREPVREDDGGIVIRPNSLRAQRQRQLLHPTRACRPNRRPDSEAAGRRAFEGVRGQVEGIEERPPSHCPAACRITCAGPRRSRARPEGAGPCDGEWSLSSHRRRLPVGLHCGVSGARTGYCRSGWTSNTPPLLWSGWRQFGGTSSSEPKRRIGSWTRPS